MFVIKSIFTVSLIFVILSSVYCQINNDSSYFPIVMGMQWTYEGQCDYNDTLYHVFVDKRIIKGDLYYGLQKYEQYAPFLWFREDSNKIYAVDTWESYLLGDTLVEMIYDFSAEVGENWIVKCIDDFGGTITLESKNETIVTPYGTFENCYHFHLVTDWPDALNADELFARGAGKVYYTLYNYNTSDCKYLINIDTLSFLAIKNNPAISTNYQLLKNYPNPFNSSTIIIYSLKESYFITLKIYNMLGQEIYTLINRFQTAGEYRIQFNAQHLPSGIYFYRLMVDKKVIDTKKMILIR